MLYVGKDILAQPGDRVMLSKEGSAWCQQRYPVSLHPRRTGVQEWSAASVLLVAKLLRRLARPLAGVTVDCNTEAEHHGCAEVKRS